MIEPDEDFDSVPANVIPFPALRPNRRLREAWADAAAKVAVANPAKRKSRFWSPLDAVPRLIKSRSMPAMPWPAGWMEIAARAKIYAGECIGVVGGIGGGKTSFGIQTGLAVAGAGHPVIWAPLELDEVQVDLRIVANMHGVHMSAVREEWSEEAITRSLSSVDDMWHYVDQHDDAETQFDAIEQAIEIAWLVYRAPPLVVVDHIGELVADQRDDRAAIRLWAQRFRRLAVRTNSWNMLLCQVSKGNQATMSGKVDVEAASDALAIEMGSQAIASAVSASVALTAYKADDADRLDARALVSKARNTGREGQVGMSFQKAGGVWAELGYLPATPSQAKAEAEADKRNKHRPGPPRTPAQASADLNSARAGDAAAARRVSILEAMRRHGMLGMELQQVRQVRGAGRGALVHQALQELERAGLVERIPGNKWRATSRTE